MSVRFWTAILTHDGLTAIHAWCISRALYRDSDIQDFLITISYEEVWYTLLNAEAARKSVRHWSIVY